MSFELLLPIGLLLIFVAIILFTLAFVPEISINPEHGYLFHKREKILQKEELSRVVFSVVATLAYYNQKIKLKKYKKFLRLTLQHAGNPGAFNPNEFIGLCQIIAIAVALIGFYFTITIKGQVMVSSLIVCFFIGLFLPNMWLVETVNERVKKINKYLPYAMNLIVLCMEAGLDFLSSISKYVEKSETSGDPLREELALVLHEVQLGKTRKEALENMAGRIPSNNIKLLVGAIIQAEKLGNPIAPVIKIQAEAIQLKRMQSAEKKAGQASVIILGPLMFIFGALFLVLFNSMIIKSCSTGSLF